MTPYYADESVTLYHGDCREVLAELDIEAQVLLTDPPYFQVKDDEWDRQWKQADQFLDWLGGIVDLALPLLAPSATAWVFAGPALVSRVEREVIAHRLRVLNSVRWLKEAGWHKRRDVPSLRRYETPWEGVILAEQLTDEFAAKADEMHKAAVAPVAEYIRAERLRAGVERRVIAERLAAAGIYRNAQTGAAKCSDWELGDSLPTEAGYAVLRSTVGPGFFSRGYDDLRRQWDELTAQFYEQRKALEERRRPFMLDRATGPVHDVWDFAPISAYPGKHPCEKPLAMLLHMIETTSRPGDLILDPFAGSGSTADAARTCGRRALLIEKDERYCAAIAARLSQGDLFEGIGA